MPNGEGARRLDGWRCLRLKGPFALDETGVLAPLATALAAAGVSLLPIATFDTDYLLVPATQLDLAITALEQVGCNVEQPSP
jgi:hypothetical protein